MKTTLITLMLVAVTAAASIGAQKPVRDVPLIVDAPPPPATPAAMVAAADAVVLAKYTGRHWLVEHPVPGVAPRRSTSYSFEVTEILKLHEQLPLAGGEVQIELPGGDKEEPGHIERMRDRETRPLVARDDYVLFLKWNVLQQKFVLPWGAAAIYDVSDGAVTSLRSSWPRHDGTAAKDFLANVRRAK